MTCRINFLYIIFFICIFHSTRINLRAMILRGSAGRIFHLENVKSYMSYLQQYTKIIKMLTLKTYFSWIWSELKRTRSWITSNLSVSNWKSSYYHFFPVGTTFTQQYKCGGYVPCCATVNTHTIVNWKNSTKCYWRLGHILTNMTSYEDSMSNGTKGFSWKDLPS
jgi:hypothetical protein